MLRIFSLTGLVLATIVISASSSETTIHKVVSAALSHHPRAEIADAVISVAKGNRLSELSLASPTIALEFEGIPEGSALSDFEERRLSISQELDFPLHTIWKNAALNVSVDQARAQSVSLLLDLEMDVRLAYLNAWAAQERVKILNENAGHLEAYASKIERMEELGESTVLEAHSARVKAIIAKNDSEIAQRDLSVSLASLQNMTGIDLHGTLLISPLSSISNETDFEDSVSIDSNPDAKSLAAEIRSTSYENLIAVTGWLPELEIAYFLQNIPVEDDPNFWGIEVGISVPLWFWWGGRGEIRQTKARKRIAENELRAFEIEFASNWNQSVQNYRSAYLKVETYKEQVMPLAEVTSALAEKSYSIGEATYLEVLIAARDHLEIQLEYLESKVVLYEQIIQLDRLSGQSILSANK
ncbi:hypothetical protein CEE37_06860 [candidate division LCP-89 bacterium B3_LCP]|uniref:Transporter n=1 Tax=candidate division LCP-89 bacterium B3_LCP TaxID=2012998 RepID=A0A532V135_UNCL8|nr:MAG: hypothetical protein CEE37_06860 [candidate division LCP-89 bacterium B3_LCP]